MPQPQPNQDNEQQPQPQQVRPSHEELIEDLLRDYPLLTREEARKHLEAFD